MSHLFYAIARDRRIIQEELPRTAPRANGPSLTEIGRASCRERGL